MRINILDLKYVDSRLKKILFVGIFFYVLSSFSLIMILNFRFTYDIDNLLLAYGLYFILNFFGLLLVLSGTSNVIDDYKIQIEVLSVAKKITDEDKINLFRKIKYLEQELRKK